MKRFLASLAWPEKAIIVYGVLFACAIGTCGYYFVSSVNHFDRWDVVVSQARLRDVLLIGSILVVLNRILSH